jgi:hypothetical protein
MACGACVLGSDAGGIPDVLGLDEQGGRLFRSGDAHDLADKLIGLLEDPVAQDRYRKQARLRAERLFRLDDMVAGFVNELHDVAGRSPACSGGIARSRLGVEHSIPFNDEAQGARRKLTSLTPQESTSSIG